MRGGLYSLRLCAVLKVTHSSDGFGPLASVAVASMNHLGVSLFPTSILGVLKPCPENPHPQKPHVLIRKTVHILLLGFDFQSSFAITQVTFLYLISFKFKICLKAFVYF